MESLMRCVLLFSSAVVCAAGIATWVVQSGAPLPPAAEFVAPGQDAITDTPRATASSVAPADPVLLPATVAPDLRVLLRDEEGVRLDDAIVAVDRDVGGLPIFRGVDLARWLLSNQPNFRTLDGCVGLARSPDEALAIAAGAPGMLPQCLVLAADATDREVTFTLRRSGGVRGVVTGLDPGECCCEVVVWRAADPRQCILAWSRVDASGRFAITDLEPGAWLAAAKRSEVCSEGGLPSLDHGIDRTSLAGFQVAGGEMADVAVSVQRSGILRGHVLLRGQPCAAAQVFGSRRPSGELCTGSGFQLHPGNPHVEVDAAGAFAFRYREAGPVELRVRHPLGGLEQLAASFDLPPPGRDVPCTLEIATGGVRGRFDGVDGVAGEVEKIVVTAHPVPGPDDELDSTRCRYGWSKELSADGSFAFDYLPSGDWLVSVVKGRLLCQREVHVESDVVDAGELRQMATVRAEVRCSWPDLGELQAGVVGVAWRRLRSAGEAMAWLDAAVTWFDRSSVMVEAPPGRYALVPYGTFEPGIGVIDFCGIPNGPPMAEPQEIELRADGTVSPAEFVWRPLPRRDTSQPK